MEDETDQLIMLMLGAFKRRVNPLWIDPSKGGWIRENHGVSVKDGSPEGTYPGMIVPVAHYDDVLVLIPENSFKELLDAWKETHPHQVKAAHKITQRERQEKALSRLRFLFM